MKPILFNIFSQNIPAWHFFYFLGAVSIYVSFAFFNKLSKNPLSRNSVIDFYILLYICSYVGARGFSAIMDEHSNSVYSFVLHMFALGPMTFYGGFILALIVGTAFVYIKKLDGLRVFDISILSVFIGLFFGRIGCFFNGDDYGAICDSGSILNSMCIIFPNLKDNLFRYPVQLFEASAAMFIYIFGAYMQSQFREGMTGFFCILLYSVSRFFLEFYRGDERGHIIFERLSSAQTLSVGLLVVSLSGIYLLSKRSGTN